MVSRATIPVVAGLLQDAGGRILITQRRPGASMALRWEFPGGKVEPGESDAQALKRELREELAIEVRVGELFLAVRHSYPEIEIDLRVYACTLEGGAVEKLGVHDLAWVVQSELGAYDFAAADEKVVARLEKVGTVVPARKADEERSALFWDTCTRQMLATRQLETLLSAFEKRGIEVVLLKGAAYWTFLYRLGERGVTDLDLLICERDRRPADEALRGLGYKRQQARSRPGSWRTHFEVGYLPRRPQDGLRVDLHMSLVHAPRYDLDVEDLFRRAVACRIGKAAALRLGLEDALLHLAVHRTVHAGGFDAQLHTIKDADLLVRNGHTNWQALRARATSWGCTLALWLLLDSARARHQTPVPLPWLANLAPGPPRSAYLPWIMTRNEGAWVYRFDEHPRWARRLALFPLVLDRPRQHARSLLAYARWRVKDRWALFWQRSPRCC